MTSPISEGLSKKIAGIRVWELIGITIGALIVIILLILFYLCFNSRKKSRGSSNRLPVSQIPSVSKEIREIKIDQVSLYDGYQDGVVCNLQDNVNEKDSDRLLADPNVDKIKKGDNESDSDSFTRREKGGVGYRSKDESGAAPSPLSGLPDFSHLEWGHWFTLRDLEVATDRFSKQNVVSEGGYGIVYRRELINGTSVAIKRLLNNLGQAEKEFRVEVEAIGHVRHKNLVRLLGYCVEGTHRIYNIVEVFFGVRNPTANLLFPHLQEIRAFLTQESNNSDEFVKSVALKMLKWFNKYWKDMYLVLSITAFLDPRYKMKFIEFSFFKLEADDGRSKAASILDTICKLHVTYVVKTDQKEYLMSDSSSDDDEDGHSEKKCINLVDRLDMIREYGCSVQYTDIQPQKSDLDLYLEEPVFPWTEKFSVLHWWKDNHLKYPNLSRMARDFLAIPMTVATSYDAYYTEPRQAVWMKIMLKERQ